MQKGSVEKFIIALETSQSELDHSQMRFVCGGSVFESPWGMFISYVCPQDWVKSWDEVSYTTGSSLFVPNETFLKRNKVKNDPFDLCDKFEKLGTKVKIIKFIKIFGKYI